MNPELFFDNKKYISARLASQVTGYSQDYIGQLCRQRKVDRRRIGRQWYVSEQSILNFDPRKYVSVRQAAELTGYSQDYVGQLCRLGKLECKMENRVWQVAEDSLQNYIELPVKDLPVKEWPKKFLPAPKVLKAEVPSQRIVGIPPSFQKNNFSHFKIFGKIISAAIFVVLAVGMVTHQNDILPFAKHISQEISQAPKNIYQDLSLVSDYYAAELGSAYLSLGTTINSLGNNFAVQSQHFALDPKQYSANIFSSILSFFKPQPQPTVYIVPKDKTVSVPAIPTPLIATATTTQTISKPVAVQPAKTIAIAPPNQTVTKIIEKIVPQPYAVSSGITQDDLTSQLLALKNQLVGDLNTSLAGLSTGGGGNQITNVYQQIAQSQAIDNLTNTNINTPTITNPTVKNGGFSGTTSFSNILASGNLGIGTTSPAYGLDVNGTAHFTGVITADSGFANTSTATSTFAGDILATGLSAWRYLTANVFSATSTTATSTISTGGLTVGTNQFVIQQNSGNIGIGTSSPYQKLSLSGSGYITGGLGIGVATTTSGVLQTSGDAHIGGNLFVDGNSTTIGTNSSGNLIVNSSLESSLVPDQNITYNLGSPSFYWNNIYVGTVTANSISAASSTIAGTSAKTFTIDSAQVAADSDDQSIIFFRGSVVPNALLTWNHTAKRFEFNQPAFIQDAGSHPATTTLLVQGEANQTADIFQVASTTGTTVPYFNVTSNGNVGIGTSTPGSLLAIQGIANFTTATSSLYSNGISLTSGCFAIGTTCIGNFNNTLANGGTATTTFYSGGVVFSDGNKLTQSAQASNFFWDEVNKRLGLGTSSPKSVLAVSGNTTIGADYSTAGPTNGLAIEGNVGIGTTTPSNKLDLNGNFYASGTGYFGGAITATSTLNVTGLTTLIGASTTNIGSSGGAFFATGGGNVGIATTSPAQLFAVAGNSYFSGNVGIGINSTGLDSGFKGLHVVGSGGAELRLQDTGSNGNYAVVNSDVTGTTAILGFGVGTGSYQMVLNSSGNVGIGTASPGQKLDVNGSINVASTITGSGGSASASARVAGLNAQYLDGFDSSAFGDATLAKENTIITNIGSNADSATAPDSASSVFAALKFINDNTYNVQTFTSTNTWSMPTGWNTAMCQVIMEGGGQGGGTGTQDGSNIGGNGGQSGEAIIRWVKVTASQTVTIGGGGSGASSAGTNGSAGGDTTFGSLLTAKGGGTAGLTMGLGSGVSGGTAFGAIANGGNGSSGGGNGASIPGSGFLGGIGGANNGGGTNGGAGGAGGLFGAGANGTTSASGTGSSAAANSGAGGGGGGKTSGNGGTGGSGQAQAFCQRLS